MARRNHIRLVILYFFYFFRLSARRGNRKISWTVAIQGCHQTCKLFAARFIHEMSAESKEEDNAVEIWKMKKLIRNLEAARG